MISTPCKSGEQSCSSAEQLSRIASMLIEIKEKIDSKSLDELMNREVYNIPQLVRLCTEHGIRPYAAYTIRRACADGRISAHKAEDQRTWLIDQQDVQAVLENGISPERRLTLPIT